jgi:hypothetical protein
LGSAADEVDVEAPDDDDDAVVTPTAARASPAGRSVVLATLVPRVRLLPPAPPSDERLRGVVVRCSVMTATRQAASAGGGTTSQA